MRKLLFVAALAIALLLTVGIAQAEDIPVGSLQQEYSSISWDFPDDARCNASTPRRYPNAVYSEWFYTSPVNERDLGLSFQGAEPSMPALHGGLINGSLTGQIRINRKKLPGDGRVNVTVVRNTIAFYLDEANNPQFICQHHTSYLFVIEKRSDEATAAAAAELAAEIIAELEAELAADTPTPTPTPMPSLTPTPTPMPSLTPTPTPMPSLTPTPTPMPSLTPMPTPMPMPTAVPLPPATPSHLVCDAYVHTHRADGGLNSESMCVSRAHAEKMKAAGGDGAVITTSPQGSHNHEHSNAHSD